MPAGSESIADRLQELEQRIAAETPAVVAPPAAQAKAATKAPAKKSVAKGAPGKKTAAVEAPEPKAPAAKVAEAKVAAKALRPVKGAGVKPAPVNPAPVKAAPVKAAPVKALATKASPAKTPATKAPAGKAAPTTRQMPAFIEEALAARPTALPSDRAPGKPASHKAAVTVAQAGLPTEARAAPASSFGVGLKLAVALIVLLLAGAAGSGAAAAVESRPATWESTALVQLKPGDAPSKTPDLSAAVVRYHGKMANSYFTALSAFKAGLTKTQVRDKIASRSVAGDELLLVAHGATAQAASALAAAAAENLVETVTSDQQLEASAKGDRLRATVTALNGSAVRVKPTDRDAALAGGLAAGAVLLIGAVVYLLRRGKTSTT